MSVQHQKQRAAEAAAELIEDGMAVGLGAGSTVAYWRPGTVPAPQRCGSTADGMGVGRVGAGATRADEIWWLVGDLLE